MNQYLTSKQAAKYLGYTEQTLRISRITGRLGGGDAPKHMKINKAVRYDLDELKKWLKVEEI